MRAWRGIERPEQCIGAIIETVIRPQSGALASAHSALALSQIGTLISSASRRLHVSGQFRTRNRGMRPAFRLMRERDPERMHGIWLVLFAIAVGFTTSGVVASLYRCSGISSQSYGGKVVATAVLVLAGPAVIFRMAVNALDQREWRPFVGWFVIAVLTYWSLAIGLLILDILSGV